MKNIGEAKRLIASPLPMPMAMAMPETRNQLAGSSPILSVASLEVS